MRIFLSVLVFSVLSTALAAQTIDRTILEQRLVELQRQKPKSANPYTSFLPVGEVGDFEYWDEYLSLQARLNSPPKSSSLQTVYFDESEPNNNRGEANVISTFGLGGDSQLEIDGFSESTEFISSEEDGGRFFATDTSIEANIPEFAYAYAEIGDGTYGSSSGDYDHYSFELAVGQTIQIWVLSTFFPHGQLYSTGLEILRENWNTNGRNIGFNYTASEAGTYYLAVGGKREFGSAFQSNLLDPSSGPGPSYLTGSYLITFLVGEQDSDWYQFDLEQGDIIGATLDGEAKLAFWDFDEEIELHGSSQDLSYLYADANGSSPLPGGGDATAAFVAPYEGTFGIEVSKGFGGYLIDVRKFSASDRAPADGVQKFFVDFDGHELDAQLLYGAGNSDAVLSPLIDFLPNWGLDASDLDEVIDSILSDLQRGLLDDFANPSNQHFEIVIENSRDHPEPGIPIPKPYTRLVVGGTTQEIGFVTIGIASAIDVGNFSNNNVGVTLLNLLSEDPSNPNSLNQYAIAPGSSMIDLVGRAVGNITSHEAGHMLGNYHTFNGNTLATLQDQGGNLVNSIGLGLDEIFGSADDQIVEFETDVYAYSEDFSGLENQDVRIEWSVHRNLPTYTLKLKALLDGPYDPGLGSMNADLTQLIPNQQTYPWPPWSYSGSESISSFYKNANPESVDWVLVEIFEGDPEGPGLALVDSKALLVEQDGSIVQPFSGSLKKDIIEFFSDPGSYWVKLRHRNHLDIMSATEIDFTLGSAVLDFTLGTVLSGGGLAMRERGADWTMWAGDGDASDLTSSFDFLNIWLPANGGASGYSPADFNMDGSVTAFDFVEAWLPANGQASQTP